MAQWRCGRYAPASLRRSHDSYFGSATPKFEPSAGKGAVACATLYFLLRYPGEISHSEFEESRLRTLLNWHENEPPTKYEKHRNMAIFEKQGNRNPLIDFPDWADRIEWRLGLG
ncbi:hypothetical protein FNW02_29360 [Komarekiella sp. 'clone 1']|uniref:Endonuclease I n=1 Tax=Komarekiella delphini-convector SJRDD-AB1 TaxID=2593771 RepID=A0AA40VU58_9NOST|nr:endonuclease [Komarekiella delphini-convector]MBD6619802.1 hypothetical protein [Komarekiella delphini-convector SJRDD-AB1]